MNWFRKLMNRHCGWKYVMYKADFKGNYFYIPVRAYELNTSDGYYIDYWGQMYPLESKTENDIWYKLYW